MEFSGVDNHDDFYTLDADEEESGDGKGSITAAAVASGSLGADSTPHVQDHRGYYIMYDSAISDFHSLDEELILMASQYIEKDVGKCSKSLFLQNHCKNSFEKSCLSQKLFVTHSSVGNHVKVRTRSKVWCLMNDKINNKTLQGGKI